MTITELCAAMGITRSHGERIYDRITYSTPPIVDDLEAMFNRVRDDALVEPDTLLIGFEAALRMGVDPDLVAAARARGEGYLVLSNKPDPPCWRVVKRNHPPRVVSSAINCPPNPAAERAEQRRKRQCRK